MKRTYELTPYCHVFLLPYIGPARFGDCLVTAGIAVIRIKYDLPATMKTTWYHEMSHFTEFMLEYYSSERVAEMVEVVQRRAAKVLPFLQEE